MRRSFPRPGQQVNAITASRVQVAEFRSQRGEAAVDALRARAAMRLIALHASHAAAAYRQWEQVSMARVDTQRSHFSPGLPDERVLEPEVLLQQQRK